LVPVLAASPMLAGLTDLSLGGTGLDDRAAHALAGAAGSGRLTHLGLSRNRFSPAGLTALASSWSLVGLRSLALDRNELHLDNLGALLAAAKWDGLRTLVLSANPLGNEGAAALAGWPGLVGLTRLDLSDTELTPVGLRRLLAALAGGRLTALDLSLNARLENAGLEELSLSPVLGSLTELAIGNTEFTSRGLRAVAESVDSGRLAVLRFGDEVLLRDVVEVLAEARGLGRLRRLDLRSAHLDAEARQRLRNRWGNRVEFPETRTDA
jgi:hypothetical protein